MPHQQRPPDSAPLSSQQCGMLQQRSAKLANTKLSIVWNTTCAAAICLFFSILKPALLQSSQQIQRMPQKCWCCQAIMYTNIANGYTMQKLLPDATHPKYTGRLPTTDPTIVFHSDCVFILVQTNRYPAQILPPIAAVRGLQLYSPRIPRVPRAMPLRSANLRGVPRTRGLWQVLSIFLSQSTSMYWLRDWVDMERATEERKRGRGERGAAYMLQLATVTMPLSRESLNLVSSLYFLRYLSMPAGNNVFIYRLQIVAGLRRQQQYQVQPKIIDILFPFQTLHFTKYRTLYPIQLPTTHTTQYHMLTKALRKLLPPSLTHALRRPVGHIKNMNEENVRVVAEQIEYEPTLLKTDRIYKPTYTIEFNREGEALIYSGNPIKNSTIYFKYPYIFYQDESFAPLAILNYVLDPFELVWYWNSFFLYFSTFLFAPRMWYWRDFMYYPNKFYLLRGGRVLKVEAQTLGNMRYIYWVETFQLKPLTEDRLRFDDRDHADFLNEDGQLRYDLSVEAEDLKIWGVNMNNEQLHFKKIGTVHHPELFEAACKGYNIDTTDFVINTADNVRYREANYDQ